MKEGFQITTPVVEKKVEKPEGLLRPQGIVRPPKIEKPALPPELVLSVGGRTVKKPIELDSVAMADTGRVLEFYDSIDKEGYSAELLNSIIDDALYRLRYEMREGAGKRCSAIINRHLQHLNDPDGELDWEWNTKWNPNGKLKEEDFTALNARRKGFSNALGIRVGNAKTGQIRHDLNK